MKLETVAKYILLAGTLLLLYLIYLRMGSLRNQSENVESHNELLEQSLLVENTEENQLLDKSSILGDIVKNKNDRTLESINQDLMSGRYNGPLLPAVLEMYNLLNYAATVQKHCPDAKLMGGKEGKKSERYDGQWQVCFSDWEENCKVLSFGISNDWSFEEDMAAQKCIVHAFDPTIPGIETKSKNLHFHKIGIGKSDTFHPSIGEIKSLPSIMQMLEIDFVHMLKIDAEGYEWHVLDGMENTNFLEEKVKQITFEIHVFPGNLPNITTAHTFRRYRDLLFTLEKKGFKLWDYHRNPNYFPADVDSAPDFKARCCHELSWINTKFIKV